MLTRGSHLEVGTVDCHTGDCWSKSRFGLAIFDALPVHPAVMGNCVARSQRQQGVVLATSSLCAIAMETGVP